MKHIYVSHSYYVNLENTYSKGSQYIMSNPYNHHKKQVVASASY